MNPGAIGSVLFGSTLRIVLLGVVVVGAIVGGGFAAGVFGVPELVGVDNTFGEVSDETTVVETDLHLSNPNPIGIDLGDLSVNYTIDMNDVEMARGEKDGLQIPSGNSTLELETEMRNGGIPAWWTSHVANGERTAVGIDATITSSLLGQSADISRTQEIETDLLSAFDSEETRPVNADRALVDDPVLYINETRAQWGPVSEAETPIEMEFDVYNPNLEPYVITQLSYEITMNGVEVGEGETHEEHVIESYGTETVPLTTAIESQNLDEWWVSHLDEDVHGHQASLLRIEFSAVIELPTGDEITVPLDQLTYEEPIETDIFGEGEEAASDGGDAGDEESPDETETADDSETTDDGTTEQGDGEPTTTETDDEESPTETDEEDSDGDDGDGGLL